MLLMMKEEGRMAMDYVRYVFELVIVGTVVVFSTIIGQRVMEYSQSRSAITVQFESECKDRDHGVPFVVGGMQVCAKGVLWVRPLHCPFCDTVAATSASPDTTR
jgi:hypothetical protein